MDEPQLTNTIKLSAQRALLCAITPGVRLVALDWKGLDLFILRIYFDHKPTADEIDDFGAVCAEILADVPFKKDKVECIYSFEPRKKLEGLKCIVYCRKEE